jgi:hypothetical protein
MPLSENVIILLIVATILLSVIFIIILAFQIQKWNNENIRRRRVFTYQSFNKITTIKKAIIPSRIR